MSCQQKILAVASLALLAVACFAGENVVKLTDSTYDDAVNDGKVYFIKYFAPWCGHCKSLAPAWNELAGELNGSEDGIVIASVDCTDNQEVCQREEVSGYPTLYVIYNGEKKTEFSGSRNKAGLKKYITDYAKSLNVV